MQKIILIILLSTLTAIAMAQNEFTFDFYTKMDKESNMLFSPTSIKTVFAMAYEGANGTTQIELEKVFGFREDNSLFHAETTHLKSVANICNSTWILNNYDLIPAYINTMKADFDAKPRYTDFKNDPQGSADKINKWIEKNTNGMIKKMLTPDAVENFKMALVNAIYFKQDWKYPFDKGLTKKEEFKNLNGAKVDVDMMHSLRYFKAYDGQQEKVIELPYEDDKTSMVIILPDDMTTYTLTENIYSDVTSQMRHQKVNLDLPKFTFETPTFELKPYLQQMGLAAAFEDYADFSGMRKQQDLKIGTALHKAKVIINEEGTEAAAATVIGMVKTTSAISRPDPILPIRVDKPFYYFIKDNKTGTILFMGRINKM